MKKVLQSVQWMAFIVLANVVYPLAVGQGFNLTSHDTMMFIQRTIFMLGVAAIIQLFFGHKLYISEVPSGLWFGIFLIYAGIGQSIFGSNVDTLRVITFSIIAAGVIIMLISVFGLMDKLLVLFSPRVLATFMILLVAELSMDFVKGLCGIGYLGNTISIPVLTCSVSLVILSLILRKVKKIAPYSFMVVIIVGWALFYVLGLTKPMAKVDTFFQLPMPFPFGMPIANLSMIPSIIVAVFILISTMLASIKVIKAILEKHNKTTYDVSIKRSGVIMGLNQVLSGIFLSTAGITAISISSFIDQTKSTKKNTFLIGNILVIIVSLITPIMAFFTTLPTPVAYAAIFTIFSAMFGTAIKELDNVKNKKDMYFSVGIPIFAGIGIMGLPKTVFANMPSSVTILLSNGLVVGIILAFIIEIMILIKNKRNKVQNS